MITTLVDDDIDNTGLPGPARVQAAVATACRAMGAHRDVEVCIRFAGNAAVRALNRQWLGHDAETDVLAFPAQAAPDGNTTELGDIILAWPFVRQEALRLGLAADAHAMHLIIHATLHLFGLDHAGAGERARMRELERRAMRALGLHDPYPGEEPVPIHA